MIKIAHWELSFSGHRVQTVVGAPWRQWAFSEEVGGLSGLDEAFTRQFWSICNNSLQALAKLVLPAYLLLKVGEKDRRSPVRQFHNPRKGHHARPISSCR